MRYPRGPLGTETNVVTQDRWFPYPADIPTKVGFIIADLFNVGLLVVAIVMITPTLTR
jgi:hypothetical protein